MLLDKPAKERGSRSKWAPLSGEIPCAVAFRLVASGCLDDVKANYRGTCGGDPAALHQIRVALTRLRAAIAFFAPMVEDAEWVRLKSELKWLNSYLGPTRDLDVALEYAPNERLFVTARNESQRRLRQALTSARYKRWYKDMVEWVNHGPWTLQDDRDLLHLRASPASEFHARQLAGWHEKLVKKSHGLDRLGPRKQHRLRLASKRLRYAIEFSAGVLPKDDFAPWRAILKQLRKGQQILGELNDGEIRRGLALHLQGAAREGTGEQDRKRFKLLDHKKKSRLIRRAVMVYRKIAS